MHVRMTALVNTATDRQQIKRGAKLVSDAAKMTSNIDDLTDLHLLAQDASGAMSKFVAAIEPDATGGHKAVGDLAAEEGQT